MKSKEKSLSLNLHYYRDEKPSIGFLQKNVEHCIQSDRVLQPSIVHILADTKTGIHQHKQSKMNNILTVLSLELNFKKKWSSFSLSKR